MEENNVNQNPLPRTPQVVRPNPIPTQSSEKPKSRFKLLILLAGIIIFLILIGIAVVTVKVLGLGDKSCLDCNGYSIKSTISPTPPPAGRQNQTINSNLKTYSGPDFSFQYKPDWTYTVSGGSTTFSKTVRAPQPTGPYETLPTDVSVSLQVTANIDGTTLDNWASREVQTKGLQGFTPQIKTIKVGSVNGIQTEFPSMHGENYTVFLDGNNIYTIFYDVVGSDQPVAQDLISQILSTFKFTNPPDGVSPSSGENICVSNNSNIMPLINNFENLQEARNAFGVLALFTAPTGPDIEAYNFLSGKTAGTPGLYGNVQTNYYLKSYEIMSNLPNATGGCSVGIIEQISQYGGPTNPQYLPDSTRGAVAEVVNEIGTWKIDKYYDSANSSKYGVWGY